MYISKYRAAQGTGSFPLRMALLSFQADLDSLPSALPQPQAGIVSIRYVHFKKNNSQIEKKSTPSLPQFSLVTVFFEGKREDFLHIFRT